MPVQYAVPMLEKKNNNEKINKYQLKKKRTDIHLLANNKTGPNHAHYVITSTNLIEN